ncbi:hypothetical protein ILUMI_01117 [Ignelater luminosus]|uniref:Peptidase S1 domain-containing protein n=1 Tax=Ignelater luminosus TaxID=2038154 RepID=A0A8K0DF78_IGNLU|nr:hypothetical protein ILUMI_01117 [Ignelater luminosus]
MVHSLRKLLFDVITSILVLSSVKCQLSEGDYCTIKNTERSGTCKLISTCPSAIQSLETLKILPQTCGFKGTEVIVCCIDGTSLITPPSIISTAESTSQRKTPVLRTTSTTTPATTTTITSPTEPVFLRVGDKSKAKCKEYEQYVYDYVVAGGEASLDCVISSVPQIVGGEQAQLKEFPHMAAIGFDISNNTIKWDCGGSLISERFILTAAHCLNHPLYGAAKYVRIGDLDLATDEDEAEPQEFTIIEKFEHPEHKGLSKYNDIALLKLDRDAILNTYARPACLETNNALDMTIKPTATGWGAIAWLSNTSSTLLKVNLEYFTHEQCSRAYKSNMGIRLRQGILDNSQICAGSHNESKDSCQGDSGGPLQIVNTERVCMYSVVGITSFGRGCGNVNVPGVYTRVSNYIEWIETIVWP